MSEPTPTSPLQLEIKLFGAFRKFQNTPVTVEVPPGATVATVKAALWDRLQDLHPGVADASLLAASALSDDRQVLADTDILTRSQPLAILPPVCGG